MVQTPAQLRQWRVDAGASQVQLGEVLGMTAAIGTWERGDCPIPPLLPWALLAAGPHVKSLVLYERRRDTASRKRREKLKNHRRTVARRAARRAVVQEEMRARRTELDAMEKVTRKEMYAGLRVAERYVAKMEKAGLIRHPDAGPASFLKTPRDHVVRPRKIRRDVGKAHHFRGRPGYRLRPEDIQHEQP